MAAHSVSAAQVGIPCFFTLCGFFQFITVTHNVRVRSPHIRAANGDIPFETRQLLNLENRTSNHARRVFRGQVLLLIYA
jgi:hypothetical protein